jgi:hypothetical protein
MLLVSKGGLVAAVSDNLLGAGRWKLDIGFMMPRVDVWNDDLGWLFDEI